MKSVFTATTLHVVLICANTAMAAFDLLPPPDPLLRIPISKAEGFVRENTLGRWAHTLRKFGLAQISPGLSSTSNQAVVPLVDVDFDKEYYGIVTIGSPEQSFKMQFDTGSSRFVLSTKGCDQCSGDTHFDPSASSSFRPGSREPWEIHYGDGSFASGIIGRDDVTLGNITVRQQSLNLVTNESASFDDTVDGVMGLSFGRLSSSTTIFENMMAQQQVARGIFGFYFGKRSLNGGGEVVFGGLDMTRVQPGHTITYTNVTHAQYWKVAFRNVIVYGNPLLAKSDEGRRSRMFPAVIDTGSTLLVVPEWIADQIHARIPGSRSFDITWTVPCKLITGQLEFDIEGKRFAVPSVDLVREQTNIQGLCYSAIQSSPAGFMIIGDVFLKNNYVVFDQENQRVGFAPAVLDT